jgi:PhoH-like ATPase
MIKTYILDTNVLLNDPFAMVNGFEDNEVIVCSTTIQELDSKKRLGGELGFKARQCGKILDDLRTKGSLIDGIRNEAGGITKVEPDGIDQNLLPVGYSIDSPDNRILSTCIYLAKKIPEAKRKTHPLILVTDDVLMRISATAAFANAGCDIGIEGYKNSHINDKDAMYNGWCNLQTTKASIDRLYKNGEADKDDIKLLASEKDRGDFDMPTENEFFTFKNGSQSAMTVYQKGAFHLIDRPSTLCGWVKPKNELQTYAMWLLKNKNIPLKILIGEAGTAKTFLSLAAGLDDTIATKRGGAYYDKMLISRPVFGFGDVGFLPGSLSEKLEALYESFYDNIKILLKKGGKEDEEQINLQMEDMFDTGLIEVCGLSFIRGRSLMGTYLICDEAQNASSTLIRDVITRAGENTSIILAGDNRQIDVSNLDSHNNGLVYAASKMKGSPLCGIIRFPAEASVRSVLAKEAAERM